LFLVLGGGGGGVVFMGRAMSIGLHIPVPVNPCPHF